MEWFGKGDAAWFSGRWSIFKSEVEGGTYYEIYRWDDRKMRSYRVSVQLLLSVAVALCERLEKELTGRKCPTHAWGIRA